MDCSASSSGSISDLHICYQHEVLDLVRGLAHEGNHAIAVILHDLNLAATYCDRILLLDEADVVALGTPEKALVPEHLEAVYRVRVCKRELDEGFQLVFRPYAGHPPDGLSKRPMPVP